MHLTLSRIRALGKQDRAQRLELLADRQARFANVAIGDRTLRGVESKLQCTDLLDACGRKAAGRTP